MASATSTSSYCMYAWALRRSSSKVCGFSMPTALAKSERGRRLRESRYFFISSVVSTCTTSLLNLSIKFRRYSSFPWTIAFKDATVFGCRREAVKCLQNCSV
ncbi:hypothetical protein A2U01_0067241, partial [Trifolium medium]|nr:hypothetical protein [Trifolium medium]